MIETVEQRLARLQSEAKTREARAAEYREKMNVPAVPVEAEKPKRKIMAAHVPTRDTAGSNEARESTNVKVPRNIGPDTSRGGRKPFDRKAYQREYMRLYRAAEKLKKNHPEKDAV